MAFSFLRHVFWGADAGLNGDVVHGADFLQGQGHSVQLFGALMRGGCRKEVDRLDGAQRLDAGGEVVEEQERLVRLGQLVHKAEPVDDQAWPEPVFEERVSPGRRGRPAAWLASGGGEGPSRTGCSTSSTARSRATRS